MVTINPRTLTIAAAPLAAGRPRHVIKGISYAQPILLNGRQAAAAIEGVIRDEHLKTALLAVDIH